MDENTNSQALRKTEELPPSPHSLLLSDCGLIPKTIPLASPDQLLETLQREGGAYTDARCANPRLRAWRPLGGEWIEGTFGEALQDACKARGWVLSWWDYNLRECRDLHDEGMSLNQIAEMIERQRENSASGA